MAGAGAAAGHWLGFGSYLINEVQDKVEWTVLRGGYFMNNFLHLFKDSIQSDGAIRFPAIAVPAVDTRDIGRCAAAIALDPSPKHHRQFYQMSGPDMLSLEDVAKTLSKVLKKDIRFEEAAVEAWGQGQVPALAELVEYLAAHKTDAVPFQPEHIANLLGEGPTGLEQWARDHRAVF